MEQKASQTNIEQLLVKEAVYNGSPVGSGHFGTVFQGKYYGTLCAAKIIKASSVEKLTNDELETFKDQYIRLCSKYSTLRHPNVVQFFGICNTQPVKGGAADSEKKEGPATETVEDTTTTPPETSSPFPFVLLTEFMTFNLTSLVEQHQEIPLHVKLSILHDVSRGLNFLHAQTPLIVHSRLYSNNVLLTSQLVAKIGDLGLPPMAVETTKDDAATPRAADFMAPKPEDTDPSQDLFSYGGVIIHIITQQWPTPDDGEVTDTSKLSEVEKRKKYLDKMSGELKMLAESCLDEDPKLRPPAADVEQALSRMKEEKKSPFASMNPITWLAEIDRLSIKLEDALMELDDSNQLINAREELIDQLQEQLGAKTEASQADLFSGKVKMSWEEAAPAPVGRCSHGAILLNNMIYVGGGVESGGKVSFTINVYSLDDEKWGTSVDTPRSDFGMAVLNDKLVIVGGKSKKGDTSKTVRYLEQSNKWEEITSMSTARSNCTAVGYNEMLIVIGGVGVDDVTLSTVELYDTKKKQWYTCEDLPKPHSFLQPLVVRNTLYLLGGHHQDKSPAVFTAPLNTTARHRLKCSYYKTPIPFVGSSAAVLAGKFVITIGGEIKIRTDVNECTEVCALNVSSSTWEAVGQLPAGRCGAAAVSLSDDVIALIGGRTYKEQHSKTLLIGSFDF